jgi:hypothetical protein
LLRRPASSARQRLGLRVTAAELGNIGDEVAFFILLDDDSEWVGTLSHGFNYTPQVAKTIAEEIGEEGMRALSIRQPAAEGRQ